MKAFSMTLGTLLLIGFLAAPAFGQTKMVDPGAWEELAPGVFYRVSADGQPEFLLRGEEGARVAVEGLRADLAPGEVDWADARARRQAEAVLRIRRVTPYESLGSGPACTPRTVVASQWASFYSGSNCSGQEYDIDNFGTWDGNGCSADVAYIDDYPECGVLTKPGYVASYRIPDGTCHNCPSNLVMYGGECSSGSDGMETYRSGLGCCVDGDCGAGSSCCFGACSTGDCCTDNDCSTGEFCNGGTCCAPSCSGKECGGDGCGGSCGTCPSGEACAYGLCEEEQTGDPTCNGRSCTTGADCHNGDFPNGDCWFGECMCPT